MVGVGIACGGLGTIRGGFGVTETWGGLRTVPAGLGGGLWPGRTGGML